MNSNNSHEIILIKKKRYRTEDNQQNSDEKNNDEMEIEDDNEENKNQLSSNENMINISHNNKENECKQEKENQENKEGINEENKNKNDCNFNSNNNNKEAIKEDFYKYLNEIKNNNKEREKNLLDGYKKFLELNNEWDFFFLTIILTINSELHNFEDFPEDYSYYIYNNLGNITNCKEYINIINNPPDNKNLYEESALLYKERNNHLLRSATTYNIKLPQNDTNNIQNMNPNNNSNIVNIKNNKSIESFNLLKKEYKLELFSAALIYNSLIRNEKEQERIDIDIRKNNQGKIPIKFDVSNTFLNEDSMMAVLTGIKFDNNIIEINLSGNNLGPKSLFWLGSIFKINQNINKLDLTRCNINNDCLYMFIEGTKFTNENLNNDQLYLNKLILKDNNQIGDTTNDKFEHPLGLILRKFKLKWLNLTNAKLKNSGTCKFLKTFLELMKENKIYLENLILICNDFYNEECLSLLGEIIEQKNICPLNNLILSKNLISTHAPNSSDKTNHFEIFMKKVAQSNLKELFLISCGIGKKENNEENNDIQILYDMLCQNKILNTLRLFGNEISNMKDFSYILGIFSEYNNGLKNNTLKSLDLSKNSCNIKVDNEFLQLIEKLKLEYLDINQNIMEPNEKERFRAVTNELNNIKIIY